MRLRNSIVLSVILTCLLLFVLAGCTAEEEAAEEPIQLAFIGPLTGSAAYLGEEPLRAIQMHIEEVNNAGGVLGRKIDLVVFDDAAKPDESINAANRIITQHNVTAVLGPFNSPCVLAVLPDFESAQIPVLTAALAPDITELGYHFVFRVTTQARFQAEAIAEYVKNILEYEKVAIIYPNDDFGRTTYESFAQPAQRLGLEIVAAETHNPGETDYYNLLTKVQGTNPDMILIASWVGDGAQIVRQAKELKIETQLGGFGGLADDELIRIAGDSAEGMIIKSVFEPTFLRNSATKKLVETFENKYGYLPTNYAAEGYGGLLIVLDAIERAGSADPIKVRDAIAATDGLGSPMGPVHFDEKGQLEFQQLFSVIRDGKRVLADKQLYTMEELMAE